MGAACYFDARDRVAPISPHLDGQLSVPARTSPSKTWLYVGSCWHSTRNELFAKSFILRVYDALERHSLASAE
jgi:hypothetical protein